MSAIDHENTDDPVCPYCGDSFTVCEDLGWNAKNQTDILCDKCGEMYRITAEYSVTYTTEKIVEGGGK